jgi:hypothetical protein
MSIELHRVSVPVFHRYLDRLIDLLQVAEEHVKANGGAADAILHARLAPDMFPFSKQVEIAANFALRTCFPLAGQPVPPYGEFPETFDGLRARIARVKQLLDTLDPAAFNDAESRVLESRAGNALVALNAQDFLAQYALPNFFFHLTTAYAILRSQGLALGKEQFDGFHDYR